MNEHAAKVVAHFVDPEFVNKGFTWDLLKSFMLVFGRELEEEAENALKKKYTPDGKPELKPEYAVRILLEFVADQNLISALETEAKILDPKARDVVHHSEDFRFMLQQVGPELPEHFIAHFLKEALGLHRSDDEFNVNSYIEFLAATEPPEDVTKKKKGGR